MKTRSKVVLSVLGLLVLFGGLGAGLLLVRQNQDIARKAAPSTAISINPQSQSLKPGDSFTFSVNMNTGTNAVTAFDIRLNFDPAVIQVASLTLGSGLNGFSAFTNTFDNTAGTIAYAAFNVDTSKAAIGSDIEVLKVNATIKPDAVSGSNITFDPATAASATQEGQNVITSMVPGTVSVQGASAAPTLSPTTQPTTRATATATASATVRPTSSAPAATLKPSQTAMPLPETGTSWTTYLGIIIGAVAIVGALIAAF